MSTKNQREELMHTAIGQVGIIIAIICGMWVYTIPLYTTLSASVSSTNASIDRYFHTYQNGIDYKDLNVLLGKMSGQTELLGIIQSAPEDTQNAIKKIGSDPYLTWLKKSIDSTTSKDEKLNLILKKARLNSILPTLSPISNNIQEDTISMKKYIMFVEENILKKFDIESTASLSLQNIKYGKKGSPMPDVVGSFDNEIAFKATNENISKMIAYINLLGHPEILTDTGGLSKVTPEIMSNPLTMINALSLDNTLDTNKPNLENSGRMTLRFYIRGSSVMDTALLTTTILARKTALDKKIETTLNVCLKEVTCSKKKDFQALSRKFTEFSHSTADKKPTQGTELVYSLSSELDSIISIEDEFNKLTGK